VLRAPSMEIPDIIDARAPVRRSQTLDPRRRRRHDTLAPRALLAQLVEHFHGKDALASFDQGVDSPAGLSECLQTRVITRFGRLVTRTRDRPRMDIWAVFLQHQCSMVLDPGTLRPARQPPRSWRPR